LYLTPSKNFLASSLPALRNNDGALLFLSSDMLRYEYPFHDICPSNISSAFDYLKCHSNINGRKESIEDDGPDPLTENGRFQAETLGKNWADTRIDLLVSSPLTRAHDTAKALSDHNKGHPKIVTLHELVERKYGRKVLRLMRGDYGAARFELTGKTPHGSGPLSRFHTPAEGGESLDDVAQRAERIIRLILSKGVDLSEAPEFFLNKKTTDTPSVLPDGIPHVVIVSHNVFLGELYDKLKYWGGNYRMTACDYRNAAW
jgi:probable phosphoglycerate mutase